MASDTEEREPQRSMTPVLLAVGLVGFLALAMAVLAVVVIVRLFADEVADSVQEIGGLQDAKAEMARLQMETLTGRMHAFKLEYGRYPATSEGLQALIHPPPKSNGRTASPFLDSSSLLEDPWGASLQYYSPSRDGAHAFEIVCLGSDSAPGGQGHAADLVNSD